MQVEGKEFAYEVTISEELRALMRARNSSVDTRPSRTVVSRPQPLGVFSKRLLRVDGGRPLAVSAIEILSLCVGESCEAQRETSGAGSQTLSILMTENGSCIAHMVAEPPSGAPARPAYCLGRLQEPGDLLSMVQRCQADLEVCIAAAPKTADPGQSARSAISLKQHSAHLAEALAPFVETTSK